jgi:hypothetical protein
MTITNKQTIFYVNSAVFMSQWKGQVIAKTEDSISIRFSKKKALKFNLRALDIDFCLVTKTQIKDIGVCISKASESVSFDDNLKEIVLSKTQGNVESLWMNKNWN